MFTVERRHLSILIRFNKGRVVMLFVAVLGASGCGGGSHSSSELSSPPGFSLSANPASLTVVQQNSTTSTVTITPSNGFTGSVMLSASGLPSGVTAAFSSNPVTVTSTSAVVVTIDASGSAELGIANVTVTATSGTVIETGSIHVTVAAAPNFTLTASPSSVNVVQGSSITSSITINPSNGFNGNVNLTASGMPTGLTASFSQNPATSSSTLTLTGTNSATPGIASVTVTGTAGTLIQSTSVNVTVQPAPTFTLSTAPAALTVAQNGNNSSTITVASEYGFNSSVMLSASGLPGGITASFNPNPSSSTSVLTLAASSSAPIGSTNINVMGTSGSVKQSASLDLTVATLTVSISPATAAVVATTQSQQFTATVQGDTTDLGVTWSVDGVSGGNALTGTITLNGLYTPPSTAGVHTVTAASVADPSVSASATIAVTDLAGVLTYHNDPSRDGVNSQEYALSPKTVNTATFGKLFSCPVDGAVYTQPLWVPAISIAGGVHNVIFVATQHDSLFAFDADTSPCVTYWQVNLIDQQHGGSAGETSIFWNDVGCQCYVGDIWPEVGVTGTPVIDLSTNTLYLVSASQVSSSSTFYQRLHALDLATGNERSNSPVPIAASVAGTTVDFSQQMENQRLALALNNGVVFAGWSSHEDAGPWYGWLLGYNAYNPSNASSFDQVAVFNSTPNTGEGGIWAAGGAAAIDGSGNLYIATGNGIFDEAPSPANNDYGDSVVKLSPAAGNTPNGTGFDIADYFTPEDQSCLYNNDTDLSAGGPVLLPDQSASGLPQHLLVQIGKEGVVYLVNRDNMGHYQVPPSGSPCTDTNSQIVQTFQGSPSGFYGTPAFWQNNLYLAGSTDGGSGDYLKVFSFDPSTGQFNSNWTSESTHYYNFPASSPSISSQGVSNGIVWEIDESAYGYANQNSGAGSQACFSNGQPPPAACFGPAVLHAYDATNLSVELWDSSQAPENRDQAGNAVKFVPPTIANGKVYVSTRTEVDVYGLLP